LGGKRLQKPVPAAAPPVAGRQHQTAAWWKTAAGKGGAAVARSGLDPEPGFFFYAGTF
jgi:hypothetical protein